MAVLEVGYQRVRKGDLVIHGMDAFAGAIGVSESTGKCTPEYSVLTPSHADAENRYFAELLRIMARRDFILVMCPSVRERAPRFRFETFKDITLPVPPLAEQTRIAEFLEREAAKIDGLVAEQRRLMVLLKEKRQAVISHAATRGLNPKAPFKPSGIEWLGDVPAHWEVGPVKRFFASLDGRRIPLSSEERSYRSGEYPYYGASGIIDYIDAYIYDEDLVLVSEDGANLLNRSTPIAFVATGKYWVNNHAHILKPIDGNLRFWAERLEIIDITPVVTGSAQPKFTIEALMNLKVAVPPTEDERFGIQEHLIAETAKFDALTVETQRAIDLLQERRTALISAAVTGQIDVRNA